MNAVLVHGFGESRSRAGPNVAIWSGPFGFLLYFWETCNSFRRLER